MSNLTIESTATLNNGVEIPRLGFGTYQAEEGKEVETAVRQAIEAGYRHIDTAMIYGNEAGVGRAIRDSGVPRDQLFVTTKLWNEDQRQNNQAKAFDQSMQRLDIDYIDLYLIHWPVPGKYVDSWKILEEIIGRGDDKLRAIGVSNFMIPHLEELFASSNAVPTVNQVEFHPWLVQQDLLEFCQNNGVQHEAWSPIMQGKCDQVATLVSIGREHDKSATQVAIRWGLQKGTVTIPKTVTPSRIVENANVFDFQLSDEQMRQIDAVDQGKRIGPNPNDFSF